MNAEIICGGGWRTRTVTVRCRRRARFFGFMSVAWLALSGPVLVGWKEGVEVFAQWLTLALVLPHPMWVLLAIWYGLTEKPLTYSEKRIEKDRSDQGI
jgi:hypothetical protein